MDPGASRPVGDEMRLDVPWFTQPGAWDGGSSQRRILLPYGGSTAAELALDFVAQDVAAVNSEVWLLFVRTFDVARGGCYYMESSVRARAFAQGAADRLRSSGVACSCLVRNARRDRIAQTIVAEAEALNATMIVLGARDRTWIGVAILGSTSGAVARRSPRKVVLVRARAHGT